jgi:hypothetical protein
MIAAVIADAFVRHPPLAWATAFHAALFILLVPAALIDPAQILGISRWIKPMKFAISVPIFLATLIYLLSQLPQARSVTAIAWATSLTMVSEMVLILLQAARGVRSHFNVATPFDAAVFSTMGALIMVNTAAVLYTALLFFRHRPAVGPAHLAGIRLGLLLFVAASFEGGLMVSRESHSIGVHDGSAGLPFVNWSTGGGDLRIAHFVGLHALQGLPLLGWWLDRRGRKSGRVWVIAAAAVWAVATVLLVMQALAGQPLIPQLT